MARNVIFTLLLCVFAARTFADQVTLKNGDRLTGTIVKLDEEKLLIKSEFAGDVKLPWTAVVAIVSTQPLHVALKNGQTIDGVVTDQAELARLGHVSRARMTQIMNLLHLAPDIQEELLFLASVNQADRGVDFDFLRAATTVGVVPGPAS